MRYRSLIGTVALAAGLAMASAAQAFDDAKYPDWKGLWFRSVLGAPRFDTSKPRGLPQQAPLTPEFQKLYEASLADQAAGGQGNHTVYRCLAWGMPAMMNGYGTGIEFVVLPEVTYIHYENIMPRRIFTDGRTMPEDEQPTFVGYSIGKWLDTDGDGRFDTLEIETRNFKGPRTMEPSGLPLHEDNQTVVKERIALDKTNRGLMHDEITVIDHAFTQPWTVTKTWVRVPNDRWYEDNCAENNNHIIVGKENYFLSGDGYLMPARKDQPPPDLRYFRQTRK
jgi:hypothetical protein